MANLNEQLKKMKNYIRILERYNSTDDLETFLRNEDIEFNSVNYLGEGEYGTAYSLGNGKVFKLTNSANEFEIAGQILHKKIPGIVQYHDRGWYSDKPTIYYIVMDEVDTDSSIEDMFYRVELILTTQDLDISQINYFDEDEYDGSEGDLDPDTLKFMNELHTIYRSCQGLGIRVPDINYGNLGYDASGTLTAFDLQDRAAMKGRTW